LGTKENRDANEVPGLTPRAALLLPLRLVLGALAQLVGKTEEDGHALLRLRGIDQ
jgi:hypothetical protein